MAEYQLRQEQQSENTPSSTSSSSDGNKKTQNDHGEIERSATATVSITKSILSLEILKAHSSNQTSVGNSSSNGTTTERPQPTEKDEQNLRLDFIGPSHAVKDLFALPYNHDGGVSVAVHNMGDGTLLLDGAMLPSENVGSGTGGVNNTNNGDLPPENNGDVRKNISTKEQGGALPAHENNGERENNSLKKPSTESLIPSIRTLMALSNDNHGKPLNLSLLGQGNKNTGNQEDTQQDQVNDDDCDNNKIEKASTSGRKKRQLPNSSLSTVEGGNLIPSISRLAALYNEEHGAAEYSLEQKPDSEVRLMEGTNSKATENQQDSPIPASSSSIQSDMTQLPSPDHYTRGVIPSPHTPREVLHYKLGDHNLLVGSDAYVLRANNDALTLRETDSDFRARLKQHEEQLQTPKAQASYADAVASGVGKTDTNSLISNVSIQTCVVPSPGLQTSLHQYGFNLNTSTNSVPSSPVCTVVDAYLDNIIANVPQLAFCLQEKGFIQSIKLLPTEDIPYLSSSDLEGPSGGIRSKSTTSSVREPLFSPNLVESNASMLLQFLKTNCTRANSTYLLSRSAGESHIQLYDVTSLTEQRQRKWIWWLAMMSYRFALRLDQLSKTAVPSNEKAIKRKFRDRQRALLQNSLELLRDLADMDGGNHETICAAVSEHLADTFLRNDNEQSDENIKSESPEDTFISSSSKTQNSQPYFNVNADGLAKAHDNLVSGISTLRPAFDRAIQPCAEKNRKTMEIDAFAMQLYGLHHKLINVSLRLAEHHLRNYFSSNAMQSIRTAGRRITDASKLLQHVDQNNESADAFTQSTLNQYCWIWECCGNFARSFAADKMWRERGHACGDDVISLLQDVETDTACVKIILEPKNKEGNDDYPSIGDKTKGAMNLQSLSPIIPLLGDSKVNGRMMSKAAIDMALSILDKQKQIQRDERRVLVAAALCYSNAAAIIKTNASGKNSVYSVDGSILSLIQQRLGDACNEIGKILLTVVKDLIKSEETMIAAAPTLISAEFWFLEGLQSFERSGGVKSIALLNIALIRCNLSQCCKIRANTNLDLPRKPVKGSNNSIESGQDNHSELCLHDASRHLELAHESLDKRDLHPKTWDMVSEELAATFLILGVRRRQSLIGGGSSPVVMQALRLNPGRERSIIEPMERAKGIYQSLKNWHQVAAADYQMALFYSKVWTCQRDETKTREKLSAAFRHFSDSHKYFFAQMRSNEPTFVILSLDLSNLYSAVSGEAECLQKALFCCVDTCDAFSPEAVRDAKSRCSNKSRWQRSSAEDDWINKMQTLAKSVEERIFKLLPNLVKIEKEGSKRSGSHSGKVVTKFNDLYREILTMKMASMNQEPGDNHTFPIFNVLSKLKEAKPTTF